MRIAILTQYYPPEMGAPQARLSELAHNLVESGHTVTVLTAMPNYPTGRLYPGYHGLYRRETAGGVSTIRTFIYPTSSVKLLRRLANYFSFVLSSVLIGAIVLPRADFLITESPPLFLGISGFLLSRMKRARWIFNVSDLWPESAVRLGIVGEGLSLRLASSLESFCYRNAWLVTGQSQEILADIRRRFPAVSTYHLSNGVDTNLFSSEHRSQEVRRTLLQDLSGDARPELIPDPNIEHRCIALYAGLHGIAQGLDQILDAALLLQEVQGLQIVFIGTGPEKDRLVRRSAELRLQNVTFLEARSRERMPATVASADIALVPLKTKLPGAVPSKIYEAMGSGVPVLLIADGEAADIVTCSRAGIVVPHGAVESIASALRELAGNSRLRRQMGDDGRQAAVARFDRKAICDAFAERLEDRACGVAGASGLIEQTPLEPGSASVGRNE
jgi:colanic acid biosynthesis glycosyl transferase WcaI